MGCLFWYVSCEENLKKNNSIFLCDHFHSLLLVDPRKIFNEAYPWIQFQTYPSPSGLSDQALLWREGDGQWEESQLLWGLCPLPSISPTASPRAHSTAEGVWRLK